MDAEAWDRRYVGSDLLWSVEPNRFLVAEVSGMEPGRALDVGTGEGRNAVWLAEQGWSVTGVDFSSVGLDKAQQLASARGVEVEWVLADLSDYMPGEQAYDLVVVLYLHVLAGARREVLERCAFALAPGGSLLVVGHHARNLTEGHGGPQDPAVLFTAEEIAAELPGLVVRRAEEVKRPVATEAGTVEAIDALVRAVRA